VAVGQQYFLVPVLEEDGSAAPRFESAAALEAFLARSGSLQVVPVGQFEVPPAPITGRPAR
jgi:hypothetical protein